MQYGVQSRPELPARAENLGTEAWDDAALVARFRAGDAEAVGDFLVRYGPLVRAHYRRKIGRSMRRLVDSQDILSTIARRLCQRVKAKRVLATDSRQLWALVYRIGDDALIDRIRILSRLRALESTDSPFVHTLRQRLDPPGHGSVSEFSEELDLILDSLDSATDRELLIRWLHGETLTEAGRALGFTAPAIRKRWQRLRGRIRNHLLETERA